jgi:hypothetical protein
VNYLANLTSATAGAHSPASGPGPFAFERSVRCRLARALSLALFAAPVFAAEATPANPQSPQTWPVQTCDDVTGPGSLRYIATHALSGDTIDFSQLPMLCGMRDSTITLTAGEIVLHQASISLVGPPPGDGSVTLSGGGASRVLKHQAYSPYSGTLTIEKLRIADGYVHEVGATGGGCIDSDANVLLFQGSIVDCTARSDTGNASGGGIDALNGTATLWFSTITGNVVRADTNGSALGGGVASHMVQAKYAEIDGNHAVGSFSGGGGTWSSGFASAYSTVAENSSEGHGGGVYISATNVDSTIRNSTFSGNHSSYSGGGIVARVGNFSIYNSTVAQNSIDGGHGAGLYVSATSAAKIVSTIIATNASANVSGDADFYLKDGSLSGTSNAVMASNVNPAGFIAVTEDPQLAPLAWTGGSTRTQGLLTGSPVIGVGNNNGNWSYEQRGAGFPRATGPMPSIDIGAVQYDDRIFVSDLDHFFP